MQAKNLFSKDQKVNSTEYLNNYDRIFNKNKNAQQTQKQDPPKKQPQNVEPLIQVPIVKQ